MNNVKIEQSTYMILSVLVLLGMLSGCGPQFRTDYIYTAPKSTSGITCTYQCDNNRQQCYYIENSNKQDCEARSERNKYDCEYNIRMTKNRDPKWYECGGETCSEDTERCEEMYRSCYQVCGGKIETRTYCVSNCEQLQPPPAAPKAEPAPKKKK